MKCLGGDNSRGKRAGVSGDYPLKVWDYIIEYLKSVL
jgi:hypothetical protein